MSDELMLLEALLKDALAVVRGLVDPFPLYWQGDPRWGEDQLGPDWGGGTLRGSGCAVTCAAMMATAAGCVVTPGELDEWLIEHDGFFAEKPGFLRTQLAWEKVPEFCQALEWRGRLDYRDRPASVNVLRSLLEFGPVVAEVDFDRRDVDVDQHFVVLLRWMGEDEVEIADPWTGDRVGLVERYYNPGWSAPAGRVARVVTGLRLLVMRGGKDGEATA